MTPTTAKGKPNMEIWLLTVFLGEEGAVCFFHVLSDAASRVFQRRALWEVMSKWTKALMVFADFRSEQPMLVMAHFCYLLLLYYYRSEKVMCWIMVMDTSIIILLLLLHYIAYYLIKIINYH